MGSGKAALSPACDVCAGLGHKVQFSDLMSWRLVNEMMAKMRGKRLLPLFVLLRAATGGVMSTLVGGRRDC